MHGQRTSTYAENFPKAPKSSSAPSKKRARTIFSARIFSVQGSTWRFTFIAARALISAEKKPGRKLKAVIPGGSSAKILRADERFKLRQRQTDGSMIEREMSIDEIPMDFDSLAAAGSMAGSGGVIVLDDSRDMVWVLNNINAFYAHESCGQCTPCREGSLWMKKITDRMLRGGGVVEDPHTLKTIGDNIAGRTICAFGEACAWPTQSFVEKFREEFAARARKPLPTPLPPEYTPEELIEEEQIPVD